MPARSTSTPPAALTSSPHAQRTQAANQLSPAEVVEYRAMFESI